MIPGMRPRIYRQGKLFPYMFELDTEPAGRSDIGTMSGEITRDEDGRWHAKLVCSGWPEAARSIRVHGWGRTREEAAMDAARHAVGYSVV